MRATSESAEWIFLATNLGLEMLSAACDQASSPRRPHYALFGMLLAIAAVLISIWELIYRGKKEEVVWTRWGMLCWFYHRRPPHTPFGTLPDIYGLVAGISQCICSMVQYVYCLRHANNPFKASLLPAIFLVSLGASKLINNRMNANTTDNEDSWETSSSTEETLLHPVTANIPSLDDQEVKGNIELQEQEQEQPLNMLLQPLTMLLRLQPLTMLLRLQPLTMLIQPLTMLSQAHRWQQMIHQQAQQAQLAQQMQGRQLQWRQQRVVKAD